MGRVARAVTSGSPRNYLLPRQPLKVLIVEDDRSERFYPDAMIMDLYLLGMSGLELLHGC